MSIIFSLLFLCSSQSFAYIPEYSTVMRRWAEANPKTPFGVEYSVTFHEGNKQYFAEETWWFKNETSAEVSIRGTKNLTNLLNIDIIYDGGKKRFEDQTSSTPQEMLEFLLVQKSATVLRNKLVQHGLTSADTLRDRPNIRPGQEENYKAPHYMELTRSRGVLSYWIKGAQNAGVAIEQDRFMPVKFVFPSGAQVFFEDYAKVGDSSQLPKKKIYRWSQGEVELVQKRILTKKPTDKATGVDKITDVPLVQDFYRRFR